MSNFLHGRLYKSCVTACLGLAGYFWGELTVFKGLCCAKVEFCCITDALYLANRLESFQECVTYGCHVYMYVLLQLHNGLCLFTHMHAF